MSTIEARRFIEQVINDPERTKHTGIRNMSFRELVAFGQRDQFSFTDTELLSVLRLYLDDSLSLPQWLANQVGSLAIWHRWEPTDLGEQVDTAKVNNS